MIPCPACPFKGCPGCEWQGGPEFEKRHAATQHADHDERMCDNGNGRRGAGNTTDGLTHSSGTSREGL